MTSAVAAQREIGHLDPGDHTCTIVAGEAQQHRLVTRFVSDGLAAGERVWYLASTSTPRHILDVLRAERLDVDTAVSSGQLAVQTADDTYLATRSFDPHVTVAMMHAAVDGALAAGYAGFRVTGEMDWATRSDVSDGREAVGVRAAGGRGVRDAAGSGDLSLRPAGVRPGDAGCGVAYSSAARGGSTRRPEGDHDDRSAARAVGTSDLR